MGFFPYAGFRNVGPQVDTTVSTTATKLTVGSPAANGRRSGLFIKNHDAAVNLFVSIVNRGSAAPTISATSHTFVITPGGTLQLGASDSEDVYIASASGTVNYSTQAFAN